MTVESSTSAVSRKSDAATLARYNAALQRTHRLIDPTHQRSSSRELAQVKAMERMDRLRLLLAALGNPQEALAIVHIAGTSGKGSTATAIASMLTAAGYRTGLHTSPYLQAATEKIQIDRTLISGDDYGDLVDEVLDCASALPVFEDPPITYGEAWVAMTLSWVARQAVDVVVLETGAGGRFDLTNVVSPIISVITSIGLDHMETLGPTISDIAWHKAGIIKRGATAITTADDPVALDVIASEAKTKGVPLIVVPAANEQSSIPREGIFANAAPFQRANFAMAMATVAEMRNLEFEVGSEHIAQGLSLARIPGRVERIQENPLVLLDGAHNPQKMEALTSNLAELAPVTEGGRRTIVFGALDSKDHETMLTQLLPLGDRFIFTMPDVVGKQGSDAHMLAASARNLGFDGDIAVCEEPLGALDSGIASSGSEDAIVVTGSMYLVGNVRERWFRTGDIVIRRTPWPVSN